MSKGRYRGNKPLIAERKEYFRLLSLGMTTTKACEQVGVGRHTGWMWRAEARGVKRVRPKKVRPIERPIGDGGSSLSYDDRVVISDLFREGWSYQSIADEVGCHKSTISREISRNSLDGKYRPARADELAKSRKPRRRPSKIATNKKLANFIGKNLKDLVSPEQIAALSKQEFANDAEMWVSHETIYQSLYVQGRGELRRELALCLRTGRAKRKPQRRADERQARFSEPMLMISDRPAEALDRAVPGHWEGDLIIGKNNQSAIGTLVERATRYVMLVHLDKGRTGEAMAEALIKTIKTLPQHLRKSLTWDQGSEMSQHKIFTMATDMPVYFCDPASPWQRGSNENTNGLLRQYFPKGTDLSVHSKKKLEDVAFSMNHRIRKTLNWETPAKRLAKLLDQS